MAKTVEDAASKGTANTALGLSIGALGLKLLPNILGWSAEGGELNLFNGGLSARHGHGHGRDWELQGGIYQSRIDALQGDYQSLLYTDKKYEYAQKQICYLEKAVAVLAAVKPYEAQITDMKIKEAEWKAAYDLDKRTCKMISGEVVLPNSTTVTGIPSYSCCNAAILNQASQPLQ